MLDKTALLGPQSVAKKTHARLARGRFARGRFARGRLARGRLARGHALQNRARVAQRSGGVSVSRSLGLWALRGRAMPTAQISRARAPPAPCRLHRLRARAREIGAIGKARSPRAPCRAHRVHMSHADAPVSIVAAGLLPNSRRAGCTEGHAMPVAPMPSGRGRCMIHV